MTSASLNARNSKDLADMARRRGVRGWHSMRKDQLIRALLRLATAKAAVRKVVSTKATKPRPGATKNGHSKPLARKASLQKSATPKSSAKTGKSLPPKGKNGKRATTSPPKPAVPKDPRVLKKLQEVRAKLDRIRDLATQDELNGGRASKERLVLMCRGPFWLHAHWEMRRSSVERAKAAMGQDWHTARPVLRVLEIVGGHTSESVEKLVRDIPVHGGVNNWYIDVTDPPKSFRVEIGYKSSNNKFFSMARSNIVTTPRAAKTGLQDENWVEVAADYEKIFAMSGGYDREGDNGQLRDLFEERLGRPMGSPMVTRFGSGAQSLLPKDEHFDFNVDAAMLVFGITRSDAYLTLKGEPVRVREDGTFSVRLPIPDGREVIPIVATSRDGVEERTVVLSLDRNTKVMEPVIRDVAQ